ncbi:acyl-CoA thioesterase [Paraburkholderia youngii]|uniref:acyl-CoA thioesterase n=1 Tax=Paraburkholderia youngii TaxID=2782701 RepID=UPI00158FFEAC|nr:thioesterase family protein [Paraburkholderia youngii]NUX57660.1 acyl-CoA thioesterase [Paraburkholderia youngii]
MNTQGLFESRKLVRFQHCDPAGIVFYPQYFVLFHELIEDWFNDGLQVNYADFVAVQKLGVPTARMEVDFVAPSKIGDMLCLRLGVTRIGKSSIALSLSAFAGEALRVRIEQTIVLFSLERREPVQIPEDLRARLSAFLVVPSQ